MEELLYVEPEPEPVPEPEPQTEFVVYFAWNSPDLSEIATGFLGSVVDEAVRQQPSAIVISGHTDTSGSNDFNLGLSRERVEAVAAYMTAAGNQSLDPCSRMVLARPCRRSRPAMTCATRATGASKSRSSDENAMTDECRRIVRRSDDTSRFVPYDRYGKAVPGLSVDQHES